MIIVVNIATVKMTPYVFHATVPVSALQVRGRGFEIICHLFYMYVALILGFYYRRRVFDFRLSMISLVILVGFIWSNFKVCDNESH